MIKSDVIIIGGGPVGCVLAERITSVLKLDCTIIEKEIILLEIVMMN